MFIIAQRSAHCHLWGQVDLQVNFGKPVGNSYLSKDRLTRVKKLLYSSTRKRKVQESYHNSCFVDVGTDCAIAFECDEIVILSTRKRKEGKRKRKRKRQVNVDATTSGKNFWLDPIVQIRHKYCGKWGNCHSPIDLMDFYDDKNHYRSLLVWIRSLLRDISRI